MSDDMTVNAKHPRDTNGTQNVKELLDFLKNGEEHMKLSPNKDIVLLLGNTGSGKSTLAQFLVGDPENLWSQEVAEGSGEFIIFDKNNKISVNSTIVSHTVIPDLLIDKKTNVPYYDCPGFSDTRKADYEIGATYFIKKLLDSARSVKLVFVVNHSSVRKGVDRKDFILLLKHTVDFIKNMDKYKDSIALVVTKVENTYIQVGKNFNLVADQSIIKNIAMFINDVKSNLKDNPELLITGHREVNYFLDALLLKDKDEFKRIGIFRRPNQSGALSKIELLQNGKKNLEIMINENIYFKRIFQNDFGYTISSDSKVHVIDVIEELFKNMSKELSDLGDEIQQYCSDKEGQGSEISMFMETFIELDEIISQIQNAAFNDTVSFQAYLEKIRQFLNKLNFKSSDKLSTLSKQEEYINFLNFISNKSPESNRSSQLAKGLIKVSNYIKESQKWYILLSNLYSKFSQYEIQKKRNALQTFTVDSSVYNHKEIKLSEIHFPPPLNQIIEDTFNGDHGYRNITLNRPKINLLNRVLETTLNYKVVSNCTTPGKLTVTGQYLKLSEISRANCYEKVNFIEVFALDKVFIDTDLNKTGSEVQLSILAPIWEVVGSREITLNGKPGDKQLFPKGNPHWDSGGRGYDGKAGKPGGPAGSFFGVGKYFINDESLSISANGGNGGHGQDGGDGSPGRDAQMNDDGPMTYLIPLVLFNKAGYSISGQRGGDGGNGGVGGFGGLKGTIEIVEVGSKKPSRKMKTSAVDGKLGNNGVGGEGGQGGRHGDYTYINYLILLESRKIDLKHYRAPRGNNGYQFNTEKRLETYYVKENHDPNRIMEVYRTYFRNNIKDALKESSMTSFLREMNFVETTRTKRSAKYRAVEQNLIEYNQTESYFSFADEDDDDDWSMTSGTNSIYRNSFVNEVFDIVLSGFAAFRPWRFFSKDRFREDTWNIESRTSSDSNIPDLPSVTDNDQMFLNRDEPYTFINSHSNLLLWDVILKKLTRRPRPSCHKPDSYDERITFASNLAYSHYIPRRNNINN